MQARRVHAHRPHSMQAYECALESLALFVITFSNGCLCTRATSRGQHKSLTFRVSFGKASMAFGEHAARLGEHIDEEISGAKRHERWLLG